MKMNRLPAQEFLQRCLRYNKVTGILLWKKRPREHFKNQQAFVRWNNQYPGAEAFGYIHATGAKYGAIDSRWFYAHRIIWKLVTGNDPIGIPDHKNRIRWDNRWCNLREATFSQNSFNHSLRTDNSSGHAGVYFSKNEQKWKAQISVKKKRIYLGRFNMLENAIAARKLAEEDYHGVFAPTKQELQRV